MSKFVEDIGAVADLITPSASTELLIGAFTPELHGKYKASEVTASQAYVGYMVVLWKLCIVQSSVCTTGSLLVISLFTLRDDDDEYGVDAVSNDDFK